MYPITRRSILALSQLFVASNSCSSGLLPAQSLDSSAKPGSFDIQGTVVNKLSRSPIQAANVSLRPYSGGGAKTATSDDRGGFKFPGIPPGR